MCVLWTFCRSATAVYDSLLFQLICQREQKYFLFFFLTLSRCVTPWKSQKSARQLQTATIRMSSVASASDPSLWSLLMMKGAEKVAFKWRGDLERPSCVCQTGWWWLEMPPRPDAVPKPCASSWLCTKSNLGKTQVRQPRDGGISKRRGGERERSREEEEPNMGVQNNLPLSPKGQICRRLYADSFWRLLLTGWLHVQIPVHKVMVVLKQEPCLTGEHNPSWALHVTVCLISP